LANVVLCRRVVAGGVPDETLTLKLRRLASASLSASRMNLAFGPKS